MANPDIQKSYPLYVMSAALTCEPMVTEIQGKKCVVVFDNNDMAFEYRDQAMNAGLFHDVGFVGFIICDDAKTYHQMLLIAENKASHVCWNTTINSDNCQLVSLANELQRFADIDSRDSPDNS